MDPKSEFGNCQLAFKVMKLDETTNGESAEKRRGPRQGGWQGSNAGIKLRWWGVIEANGTDDKRTTELDSVSGFATNYLWAILNLDLPTYRIKESN